eukprot:5717271-Amphidinium_carterae.1
MLCIVITCNLYMVPDHTCSCGQLCSAVHVLQANVSYVRLLTYGVSSPMYPAMVMWVNPFCSSFRALGEL